MPRTAPTGHLVLARHGQTSWSRAGRHTGRTDVPLEPEGEDQARRLGQLLSGLRFAAVLVSPLQRARATCELAGLAAGARVVPDLAEWDYGAYEGRTTTDIRAEHPGWDIWTQPPPGGETVEEVGARAERVIAQAEAAGGDVLIVSHAHLLRVLTARWLGLAAAEGRCFVLETAAVAVLGYEREIPALVRWNVTGGALLDPAGDVGSTGPLGELQEPGSPSPASP